MREEWKDIAGYEGLYQVSNLGNVKSIDHYNTNGFKEILYKGRMLKFNVGKNGYLSVMLCKNGKTKRHYVHRLVAQAFIPNPDNLPEVNHKDEVSIHNFVDNLEWCDRYYNLNYGTLQKRSAVSRGHKVLQYDKDGKLMNEFYSTRQAEKFIGKNGANTAVSECCKGKRKTAYGYIWRYKEAE